MSDDEFTTCPCGSTWFRLEGRSGDPEVGAQGALCLDGNGAVIAYAGDLVCIECGGVRQGGALGRPRLRLLDVVP